MNKRPYLLVLAALLLTATVIQAEDRPNVIFILSDDQAWNDYGFMGHPHVKTPVLDQLASQSLLYERGYVTAPLCRASLAGLASGLHPHQTGIRGNDPVLPAGTNKRENPEIMIPLRKRMTAPMSGHPSFIKELSKNGYATLQTGKWWEGNPLDHGFTDAMTHGDVTRGGRHGDQGLKIGRSTMQPYYDFVDKAVAANQPFFVWYGVFLPHTPHNAPDRLYNKYKDIAPNEPTAKYWANIEWFDETCGELLAYLDKKEIADDTLIVYICDNGWVPDPRKVNRFTRSKRDPYEAGIRTPIMLSQTGKISPKRDSRNLASAIDIGPTILKACGIEVPSKMNGLDLRDTAALAKRDQVVVEAYAHDSDLDKLSELDNGLTARVIIEGWHKLTVRPERTELYNLKTDPDDRNDLSAENPKRVKKLNASLEKWIQETN